VNFKFPLLKWQQRHAGWLTRFYARQVAKKIARSTTSTYQFGGWEGALKKNYVMIDADKYQLVHWILNSVGYCCSTADVMERCGVDSQAKECVPPFTLTPIGEVELDKKPKLPKWHLPWIKSV